MGAPRVLSQPEAPSSLALRDQKGTRSIKTKDLAPQYNPKRVLMILNHKFCSYKTIFYRVLCNAENYLLGQCLIYRNYDALFEIYASVQQLKSERAAPR